MAKSQISMTVNGATTRPGDLFASGTVSGPDPGEWGSLVEITRRGACRLRLPDGTASRPRIGFGDASGTVVGTSEEA